MNSVLILGLSLILFTLAYRLYGRFLSKVFGLDPSRKTPAHELNDGMDYVPAKNWWVLFGHHFSSICGAGPIVGPVLAVAYWGWGISVLWIVVGAILMGAVADFSSLVVSMRSRGQSIAQVAGFEISNRAKIFFSIFLWIALILVIAVFAIFGAKTLIQEPDAVIPSMGLIPTALLTGFLLYKTRIPNVLATLIGLGILGLLLFLGTQIHVVLPHLGGFSPEFLWIVILLVYCFIASVVPVQVLLQPRDYLASFILFGVIAIGLGSIFVVKPMMPEALVTSWWPADWPKAGPLWPMLFVTIACGAISGFHSLVSSGTTCKQIASEAHACRIGYGGMLLESTVGVMVLIVVAAGLSQGELTSILKEGGPISAFSHGYGNLSQVFLGDYGKAFAILGLNAFILTTLDTATRITRYITSEVFGVKNIFLATLLVVVASAALALSGKWNLLWPVFGAANQLIAGIALLIAAAWLLNRGRRAHFVLGPGIFMLVTTIGAFAFQCWQALLRKNEAGEVSPDWLMVFLTGILIILAITVFVETLGKIRKKQSSFVQKAEPQKV